MGDLLWARMWSAWRAIFVISLVISNLMDAMGQPWGEHPVGWNERNTEIRKCDTVGDNEPQGCSGILHTGWVATM